MENRRNHQRDSRQTGAAVQNRRRAWLVGSIFVATAAVAAGGCLNTPVDTSNFIQGPAPLRMPSPARATCCYEDSLTGGQIFSMYCSYCHNAPALAERPFSNFRNVAAHMRVRANLTGKEYAKLMEFLRRWHDIPPPEGNLEPGPKRFIFSQPIAQLRKQQPAKQASSFEQPSDMSAQSPPVPGAVPLPPLDSGGGQYLFSIPPTTPGGAH